MAALSLGHVFHKSNSSIQGIRPRKCPQILAQLSCQRDEPVENSSTKVKKETKQVMPFRHVFVKFMKGIKDNLSPKHKGDWKDVVLMSLSFAVYVYISQQIVCAYCVWTSMLKQQW